MIAVTRSVSPRISECELTYRDREPIDFRRAEAQHRAYERWLEGHGARVIRADAAPHHPRVPRGKSFRRSYLGRTARRRRATARLTTVD